MEDNHSTANAEAEPKSVGQNISVADYALRRLGENKGAEPSEPVEEAVEEEVPEIEPEESQGEGEPVLEADESSDPIAEESNPEDVLSQLDLDEMSEEDLRELGQKLGSKAVARFGELTAKRKTAEEQLAKLQESLQQKNNDPLKPKEVKDNPFSKIDSVEGLRDKAEEVNSVIEWAEEVLFNSDGYAPDDVVTEVEGKELTKAEVRRSLTNARKSRDKFLPAQLQTLQIKEQGKQMREALDAKAREELSWLDGEANDTRQQYEAIMSDPRLKSVMELSAPDVAAQLPYLMAHAANSMYGRKPIVEKPANTRLNPPKQPTGAAAQSEKGVNKRAKAVKNVHSRFKQSGNKSDFITLRTLQMQNR
jgi:hypothetical protein